jgi:hypothetical protein
MLIFGVSVPANDFMREALTASADKIAVGRGTDADAGGARHR